ncbi:L,D-transpeptidase [Hansschlegelia plantiphila]|uniref:L,D-transpeptidase n=1 Tax=Hansschlegelia plantiphila TaxID=374655 RepID=A0A9W6J0X1_9HYPH|nr:L,D-transpeptidase [Hansschlegelia plantiphila]GLK67716.1 L,D-transpeptidase [Hansschlegelia plantiphila]
MTKRIVTQQAVIGLSRRAFVSALPLALGACAGMPSFDMGDLFDGDSGFDYSEIYGPKPQEQFPLAALPWRSLDPTVLRRRVDDPTGEAAGTIVVDTYKKHLYYVQGGGKAVRYGIGVGKEGFEWQGRATIARKAKWPTWTPTPEMIQRDPKLNKPWAGGMPGGLSNPLGARALYLYQNGRDSSYRIHGTTEPRSIGKAMSSGCIRMFNHDVIDLYDRATVGTEVMILS